VSSSSPYYSIADLLNAARSKPGALTLGSVGPGTASQLAFENLRRRAGVDITFVPFQGNAPAGPVLLGGHITATLTDIGSVKEQYKGGLLRPLATTRRQRTELHPDVSTVAEGGYNDYEANVWMGLFTPAKTPDEMISRLGSQFVAALRAPGIDQKLFTQGLNATGTCGTAFVSMLHDQYEEYGRIVKEASIKAD